jgi:tripartite-type tricarboxylate transporter receptor subunit TctC
MFQFPSPAGKRGLACSNILRSALRAGAALLMGTALHGAALAQPYPSRPIQIVLSFPPGGATDILARAVGQRMGNEFKQSVVIENRPGAGGALALGQVVKAAPDGYTLHLLAVTNAAIAAATYASQPAHLAKDFEPVAAIAAVPHILVVPATVPVQSVSELVALLKSAPGTYNFASQGNGTLSHLESELFKLRAGVEAVHVPYKGSAFALPDLIAGRSTFMFDSIPTALPHVKTGKLKLLALAAEARIDSLPGTPTLEEAGLKDFRINNHFGMVAPKGTPAAVSKTLAATLQKVLADPELITSMKAQGVELKYQGPAEMSALINSELGLWAKVAKAANVKVE